MRLLYRHSLGLIFTVLVVLLVLNLFLDSHVAAAHPTVDHTQAFGNLFHAMWGAVVAVGVIIVAIVALSLLAGLLLAIALVFGSFYAWLKQGGIAYNIASSRPQHELSKKRRRRRSPNAV